MIKLIKAFCLIGAFLTAFSIIDHPAFAENYPPTDGNMIGFVLLKERTPAPQTIFKDETGNEIQMADFKGKVILLNFWASWCAPCIHEMPSLDRLEADMGSEDFQVIAINQDVKGLPKAKATLRERLKLTNLKLYLDKKLNMSRDYKIQGMPATYAIDRQGRIVGAYTGPADWDSKDAKALINYLINE